MNVMLQRNNSARLGGFDAVLDVSVTLAVVAHLVDEVEREEREQSRPQTDG